MKYIRLFPSASIRDAVLAEIEHGVLSYTEGEGMLLKAVATPPAPAVDITTPFFVENISDEDGVITIWQNNEGGGSAWGITIQKSTDASNWDTVGTTSVTDLTIPIQAHSKIYLRCNTDAWGNINDEDFEEGYNSIKCDKLHNVGGNIFSLLYGSSFTNQTDYKRLSQYYSEFGRLFYQDRELVDAGDLILPSYLHYATFMDTFAGCSKLCRVKCLVKSLPNGSPYRATLHWLSGVSATGTFIKSPEMTNWPRNANGIPSGWTVEDAA